MNRWLFKFGRSRWAALVGAAVWFALPVFAQTYVNFEGKQTSPIRLSPDGTRLFAVNTPDGRLSVFDVSHPSHPFLIAEIPVGVEPVSVNPRNNDEAWVVNEVSDSISIVSVSNRLVLDTLPAKDEPADVVFAGAKAFVTESRNNQIAVFDIATHILLTNVVLSGQNPRALAVNAGGTKVYAAFALSGNRTTLVPASQNPTNQSPIDPPMSGGLPPPPQVGRIVDATDPAWTNVIRFTMPDHDAVEIDVATLTVSRYFPRVGTVNLALAVQPGSGDLFVANTDARNLTRFEPNLRGFFVTNRVARISIGSGAVTNFDLNPGYNPTTFTLLDRTNALAQPTAVAFGPGGASLYVAAFGSDRVARLDPASGQVLARIELCPSAIGSASDPRNKRGPRGLALNAATQRLYVLNRIANTIAIVDVASDSLLKEIPIGSFDPTTTVIRQGRGFLYDARLSGNGTVSCASCHVDAEMDLLAWDLGDPQGQLVTNKSVILLGGGLSITNTSRFHPMKGPMTTQTLRGLSALEPFHWRGDRTNFTHFNGAFASLLGGSPLSVADMNAYLDFINTIQFEPNPNENLNRTPPTTFAGANPSAGLTSFTVDPYVGTAALGLTCNACHALPTGTARFIVGASALQESQDFKVPHLRNLYQKTSLNRGVGANSVGGFGFLHDGTFQDLFAFLSQPVFQNFSSNSIVKSNLQAYLLCFDTGTAPAVGYTRTLSSANVNTASASNDWSTLESQTGGGLTVDLILKGTIDGARHGLFYIRQANRYLLDTTNILSLTRAQLVAKVQAGDTLTLMGVPPGTGFRLGVDRDGNGVSDADEPRPALQITAAGGNFILHWPLSAAGYALEGNASLAGSTWSNLSADVEIVGGQNYVTNPISAGSKFFRLRFPSP